MNDLIAVFRMNELSIDTRINILLKLGKAINYQYAANVTEPIVLELIKILDKNHPACKDEHLIKIAGQNE